jgi:regulator of sigma E protease
MQFVFGGRMLTILLIIVSIGIVIFVHEMGHFAVAKFFGVKVEKFSIGFGHEWFGFTKGETRYCVSIIPFGGYVKMAGESIFETDHTKEGDFLHLIWWKRLLVILFGPFMNFIFAILLFTVIVSSSGIMYTDKSPIIGDVMLNYPAYESGIRKGDIIYTVNGKTIDSWDNLVKIIDQEKGNKLGVQVLRSDKTLNFSVNPIYNKEMGKYVIGISANLISKKLNIFESFFYSIKYVFIMCILFLKSLFLIIFGKLKAEFMGPVGVVHSLGGALKAGYLEFFNLVGMISINLGFINLLPFPVLDGGYIAMFIFEAIYKKPISKNVLQFIYGAGIVVLVLLMIIATKQDFVRIFFGN